MIDGIKYVELDIRAHGYGVVNWNGVATKGEPVKVAGQTYVPEYSNHTIPKLRNGQIYVSSKCIRHYLFREEAFGLAMSGDACFHAKSGEGVGFLEQKLLAMLSSSVGLLRGYLETVKGAASGGYMKASPLTVSDFEETLGNVTLYEQHCHGADPTADGKGNTFFSRTTAGETAYRGRCVIGIEDLQFISLSTVAWRCAYPIQGGALDAGVVEATERLRVGILDYLERAKLMLGLDQLKPGLQVGLFSRRNALVPLNEYGLLLDQDAIEVLVQLVIARFKALVITQGQGMFAVDDVRVCFSDRPQRWDTTKFQGNERGEPYAQYYEAQWCWF
ncbi:type I-Fv CRISPR-associated protein Cas7fv [Ferrimonas marina]|uniref:Uncharacterized protein n=1 Tax=Ferrimonas marina TaxID=299255 RepID=A0A1M5T8Q7_9GAMM|nr:type I-Fv CRISPR-associated protein Cas7fv [Ferrimonas marina]SHH47094.1 hypothetical protein SAMN02745129_2042 [Ferrimonas marina]